MKISGETVNSINILVPDPLVDEIINHISTQIDLRHKTNTISIIEVEGFVSTHLDRLKGKAQPESTAPNPIERLIESTDRYTHLNKDILSFVVFSTIIALVGLFQNSETIVIGAMLLSPLLGPINAFAVNANLGRVKTILKTQETSLLLLSCVISTSFIITFFSRFFTSLPITSQIMIRSNPTIIDILLAFILGCAAGLALITDFSELLVGVAIAVALVPPAAVTGIGLAMLNFKLAFEAFLLTLINLLGLQLGSIIILNLKGVTPRKYYQKNVAQRYYKYFLYIILTLLTLLALILYIQNRPS